MEPSNPHDQAATLRHQEYGRTRPTAIPDALVEPAWPGQRVFAAIGSGRGTLWDDGEAVDDQRGLAAALVQASTADDAIFEAYLTRQTASEGVGVNVWVNEYPTMAGQMSRLFIGGRRSRLQEFEQRQEAERAAAEVGEDDVMNLVVVDLLWLDGQLLLDVPLLERRRILDSIVPPGPLVRPGPFVRHPIGSWIGSWRAQGFRAMTFKAANSRYRPGETADDWTLADMPRR